MDMDEVIQLAVIMSLVVLPALALTARFALKPIVDAILRLKEGGVLPGSSLPAGAQDLPLLVTEVRHLRDEMAQLQQTVAQLQDAASFDRSLAERPAAPQIAPPPEA